MGVKPSIIITSYKMQSQSEGNCKNGPTVVRFRSILESETCKLTQMCDRWVIKLEEASETLTPEIKGEIRSIVGQGRLLMAERFGQFSALVDNCEFKKGEKETTCTDLQGFWEMIYIQVEDVYQKFSRLEALELRGWVEDVVVSSNMDSNEESKKLKVKKIVKKRIGSIASPGVRQFIAQQREKKKRDVNMNMNDKLSVDETVSLEEESAVGSSRSCFSPERTFDGGFFSVKSPAALKVLQSPRNTRSAGCEKVVKIVKSSSSKRMSGLVSPYVSQVAKRVLDTSSLSPVNTLRRSSLFEDV